MECAFLLHNKITMSTVNSVVCNKVSSSECGIYIFVSQKQSHQLSVCIFALQNITRSPDRSVLCRYFLNLNSIVQSVEFIFGSLKTDKFNSSLSGLQIFVHKKLQGQQISVRGIYIFASQQNYNSNSSVSGMWQDQQFSQQYLYIFGTSNHKVPFLTGFANICSQNVTRTTSSVSDMYIFCSEKKLQGQLCRANV